MTKNFNDGTYVGKAKGMGGLVTVKLTVANHQINQVEIVAPDESKDFGKSALKKLQAEILQTQNADVDAVSGASVTSWAVKDAAQEAIEAALGQEHETSLKLNDGTYEGTAEGHGGPLTVAVTTKDNRISKVQVVKNVESPHVGDYAMKFIPEQIVKQQTLGVDAVSGATLTSKAILAASKKAVAKAGGDVRSRQKQPYQKPQTPAKDLDTDLVIAGGGLAGLATATFALMHGLKVVLLEKNDQPGGSFRYAAGAFATTGSKELEKLNQTNQIDELLNWVKQLSEQDAKRPIDLKFVRYLATESGKTFDDLLALAHAKPSFFLKLPYTAAGFAPGAKITEVFIKYIQDHQGIILNDTVISKVDWDHDHATGVEAKNASGSFTVKAKAVVMATGGASYGQEKMLQQTTPSLKQVNVANEANPANTGDGYPILKAVGAKFFDNDVYKNAELDFAPQLHTDYNNEPDYSQAMVVNSEGKRFTNEAPFSFLNLTTALYREGSPRYYTIYDSQQMDPKFKARVDALPEDPKVYVTASSMKELAAKTNLNAANLQAAFDQYQKACETGQDEFGKNKKSLVKLASGKYYAIFTRPGSWGTIGGVKINQQMQVEKADGSYFDNLYALGELSTGDLFCDYYMIGFSLADYSTEGRLVAEELTAKIKH